MTKISTQTASAREAARHSDGKFGEQNLADPGSNVLTARTRIEAALLCGRCGVPVHLDHGSIVDETGSNSCGDDVHAAHRYDTPEIDELSAGNIVMIDGSPATIVDVEQVIAGGDPEGRLIRYRTAAEPDELYCDIETAGARLYRLTSPALTQYPMNAALDDYGVGGLICGRCGEPVIDWRGTWVDESKSTRCGTGHHSGAISETVGCAGLNKDDVLILGGERVVVVSLDNDNKTTSIEYGRDNPFTTATVVQSFRNDDASFERITSGSLPAATNITEGPDPVRFSTAAMVRAERALEGASVAGDSIQVREAAAVVNLMRARRLADSIRMLHPTSEQVVLEPAADESSDDLQVAGIRLADGTTVTRDQIRAADQGVLDMLDGEACRLSEDGDNDWIRTCSTSSRGRRHVMELFEASRIDRIDLARGTYDPNRH